MKNKVISEEVALVELENFVNKFLKKPCEPDELAGKYPDVLDAIMHGHVVFDENSVPTYTLKDPLKNDKGDVSETEIKFRTRIFPTDLADQSKGVHPQDVYMLQLKLTMFIIDKPYRMANKFSRYDWDAIYQIATVFS